jgi:DNA modification methylase
MSGTDALDGFLYGRRGPVTLYLGDAIEVLAAMPDGCVDAVVTSPPFWGLRDYGTGAWSGGHPRCGHRNAGRPVRHGLGCSACGAVWRDGQYGLEPTVDGYVHRLTGVFDQVRRVLTSTGTCWLNLGDSYTGPGKPAHPHITTPGGVLPAKSLIGVPWRVAFALQASGWYLRNAIIWAKPNPMPESVTDRLSTSYELLFLLTRSARYHFTLDPIRLPLKHPRAADGSRVFGGVRKAGTCGLGATARRRGGSYGKHASPTTVQPGAGRGNLTPLGHAHTAAHPAGRNPGDVWTIATRPYRGAHVAPFPVDLPLRAIAAGCPPGGLVLDPFSGAGTTGLAALVLGRRYIGVDIAARFHDETLTRLSPHLPPSDGGGGG